MNDYWNDVRNEGYAAGLRDGAKMRQDAERGSREVRTAHLVLEALRSIAHRDARNQVSGILLDYYSGPDGIEQLFKDAEKS